MKTTLTALDITSIRREAAEAAAKATTEEHTELRKRTADTFLAALRLNINVDQLVSNLTKEGQRKPHLELQTQGAVLQGRFARIFFDQINLAILRQTGKAAVSATEEEKEQARGAYDVLPRIAELIEDLGDKANAVAFMWEVLHVEQMLTMKLPKWQLIRDNLAIACVVLLLLAFVFGCYEGGRFEVMLFISALLTPAIFLLEQCAAYASIDDIFEQ